MARQSKRLSARFVQTATEPGMHADGDGLYLVIGKTGAKRWAFIFFWAGKRTEMGLGSLAAVSLADAREAAEEARRLVSKGQNPIEARNAQRKVRQVPTFGQFAEEFVTDLLPHFRNPKHRQQWISTLSIQRDERGDWLDTGHCVSLRDMKLDAIGTEDVLGVLTPIWSKTPETASRLQNRIERVLDAAKVKKHRTGDNPARWRGHLNSILKKRSSKKVRNHPALAYKDLPDFMARLRERSGMGARALEFTILTAKRTGETRFAEPGEFRLDEGLWVIPEGRMKGEREHTVVLCERAVEIVRALIETATGPYVFAGQRRGRPISEGTMTKAMKSAGAKGVTVHGFRSTFKDWATEETNFDRMLAEAALSHLVGDETERAYKRGEVVKKRKRLMDAWEGFCDGAAKANVITMPRRA